jgi:hypothetical protein
MENSLCEAECCLAAQGIPRLLCNPSSHYRVHKSPPLDPVPNQMNPVYILTSSFFKIRFNIILPAMLGLEIDYFLEFSDLNI